MIQLFNQHKIGFNQQKLDESTTEKLDGRGIPGFLRQLQ